ncbi:MAG TPA: FtsX-like permease family protein, partial [Gemmatimonadales bacterium]|nr:FtsX-like permease family protein [Gemmatimonadales bacterium]
MILLAAKNLARHRVRNTLAGLGIAVAAALLLDMVMLAGGMERSFERMLLSRGFQIRLAPKGTLPFDTEATFPGGAALSRTLRADSRVSAAGAVLGGALFTRAGDSLIPLAGLGVEPEGQGLYELDRGADLVPGDTAGIVIGASVAARTGWNIGDTVLLSGGTDPQVARVLERRVMVRGVVHWLYESRGERTVGVTLPLIRALTGRSGDRASMIMVKVARDADVEPVAADIRRLHPGVEVNSVATLIARFRTRLTYFRQLSLILGTISLFVGVLLVSTLLTITVNERLGEIATLRAIGVSRGGIVRRVLAEGALLSLAGNGLGLVLGLATARYLDGILTTFPGLPAAISFFVPERGAVLRAALALLAAGTLAGAWPAWRAARAPIAAT